MIHMAAINIILKINNKKEIHIIERRISKRAAKYFMKMDEKRINDLS